VALSLLLVAGAGLFTTSLLNLTRVELGFRTGRLLTFSVDATQTRPEPVQAVSFYRDLLRRFQAIPGVTGVGAADGGPFSGHNSSGNLTIEGYQAKPQEYVGSRMVAIGPGFFQALGVPVRAGREFQDRDEAGSPKVVVVNEAFARKYFAGRDPVGRRLMFGGREPVTLDREIVGVVADVKSEVRKPAVETVFLPFPQWARAERLTFYARTTADDARAAADVRRAVRAADANVPVGDLKPMDVLIRESITSDRLIALLSIAFGLLATVLAAVGLYGVVAYSAARRTSEIGVRIALGASPAGVLGLILREAGLMAGVGIAVGLAGAIALGRFVESQLFGVKAADPLVFAGAALLLALIAVFAALVPGWRASRTDPIAALKYD
jgi:predicted permease